MKLIHHIKASNLLSFGPEGLDLEMNDLNVLIGPNGSGKSNFLEIFELIKSLPKNEEDGNNLFRILAKGGGFEEWKWKGDGHSENIILEIISEVESFLSNDFLTHKVEIDLNHIEKEKVINARKKLRPEEPSIFYQNEGFADTKIWNYEKNELVHSYHVSSPALSILSQRNILSNLTDLAEAYERIRLYREWSFGRNTIFRKPQQADLRNDRMEPDFSNLGMILSRLRKDPKIKRALVDALKDLYEGVTDFEVIIEGGTVQVFFTEGDFSIPATRLSDGTLRYLCLLAILLDPTPPPLICIEEPELGLHPDILPKIADLLVDASSRTQLIVTTHSDVLIDALTERPEAVLVFEKVNGQTKINRLNKSDLEHWLKDYRLGQLWLRGEIGGTRW